MDINIVANNINPVQFGKIKKGKQSSNNLIMFSTVISFESD